jgi:hypothetical protein
MHSDRHWERERDGVIPFPRRIFSTRCNFENGFRESGTSTSSHLSRGSAIDLVGTSQLLISRVYPSNKSPLIGNLEQQSCKDVALLLIESREQCVLMFLRHLPNLPQDLVTF